MGRKYIIEIIGGEEGDMDFSTIEPYTAPDLDAVRKEAYYKGYETAKHECEDCNANAVKIADDNAHEAYQKGLEDAWDAARKVTQVRKYGGYGDCLGDVFGRTDTPWDVFDYSAPEAIEKIRQYEQEKEEQIQVGDEIETPSGLKGYVVNFTDDELVHYVSSEGRFGTMGTSAVSKTGRHFPEIAEVLQKMKESE